MSEDNKFNAFQKAQGEVTPNNPTAKVSKITPQGARERKEQMSIMLTPTHKRQIRQLADSVNMSVSELIGLWVDQNIK